MGLLDGKVALITGGARGQGRAHAVVSAREGADVIVVDIDAQIASVPYELGTRDQLAETVRMVEKLGRRAIGVVADVRSQRDLDDAVAQGIAEFGKIDILIANAGIISLGPVHELTDEQWQDTLDVNLTGVWRSVKAVLPHMIERRGGSIVMTSSINGEEPAEEHGHYTASKHGVLGLMKTVALEGARHGIRCNAIKPGAVWTAMVEFQELLDKFAGQEGAGTPDMLEPAGYHYHALPQTLMDPEVCAHTALYLNSDLASVVTGAAIPVDAGHLLLPGFNHAPTRPE
ncbi:mycofactocin-coupled SDR family oxidoreductase [Streptomyces sp. NPDC093591]|uniref:mycofactocin-coupled SDR family oxidoreductase n=1 Tax=Streptomyces sp. NPDC093591 TaxID=3366044 RepID=UPI0037F1B33B